MNLVEIQQALQGLPDDALIKEMQSPTGTAPQYMVLSELQRRKAMRMQANVKAPTTTVRQDVAGFAGGGEVENKPGWMSDGIGSFISPLLGMATPWLNDVADGSAMPFGLAAPWLLRQLGFGNEGRDPNALNKNPNLPKFGDGGAIEKVRQSESGKAGYNANNVVRDKDGKILSQAIGRDQFTVSTWNDYADQLGLPRVDYGTMPGDPGWPTKEAQDIMGAVFQNDVSNALTRSGWDRDDPANRKVTQMFGVAGGPKLLDIVYKNPKMRTGDALAMAMGEDAARRAIVANKINPNAPIDEALHRYTSKVGGAGGQARYEDQGISRADYIKDLQATLSAPEDPDYVALSSVPRQGPQWTGSPPLQMMPGRPMLGPPMNVDGIDSLIPKLVAPQAGQPAPWQMIQKQSGIRGFADGGYTGDPWGDYWDARVRAMKMLSDQAHGDFDHMVETGPWADNFGMDDPEATPLGTVGRVLASPAIGIGTTLAGTAGLSADIAQGAMGFLRDLNRPYGDPSPPKVRPETLPLGKPKFKPRAEAKPVASAQTGTTGGSATTSGSITDPGEYDALKGFLRNRDAIDSRAYDAGIPTVQRDKDRDRWLALGEFGSRLAAGNSPYFAQNFGPAAQAGIASYRQSEAQYDDDAMKQAEMRLRQAQLNETAAGRRDTAAIGIGQIEGSVTAARVRAGATLMRLSQQLKYGQSIDPQAYTSRLRDYTNMIANDPTLTLKEKLIETRKAEAMVYNDLMGKGIFKAQKGLDVNDTGDDGQGYDGDIR